MVKFMHIIVSKIQDAVLCAAAREKSKEIGIDISFVISDENGLPKYTAGTVKLWC